MIRGFLTDHSGSLAGSGSQTLITATGNTRTFFYFQNQGAAAMYIAFGGTNLAVPTAVATEPCIEVAAGATLQFDHFVPQGSVAVIGTSTQKFTCKSCGE